MPTYSYSRISTFEQCPLKFKYRYIDKIIPKIGRSIEAHLGGVVHSALEWLYTLIQEKKIPSIEELVEMYGKIWQEEYQEDTLITNKTLTVEDYFNKGVKFLTSYYLENYPFDDNTIEVEKKITVNLEESGEYQIIGFIDRLSYNLDSSEYEIHDYKTFDLAPSKEKLHKDRQLGLYCLAIKQIYGEDKEVNLTWHFLAYNRKLSIKKTKEQLEELKKETIEAIKNIESEKEFPPHKTKLCDWCEYKDICPAWNPKNNKEYDKYPTLKKYIKE